MLVGLVRISLPDSDSIGSLEERMPSQRVPLVSDGASLAFEDPWSNRIEATPVSAVTGELHRRVHRGSQALT